MRRPGVLRTAGQPAGSRRSLRADRFPWLRGPAITEIDSQHLRGGPISKCSCPRDRSRIFLKTSLRGSARTEKVSASGRDGLLDDTASARLLLLELDEREYVLPYESADRPRAVLGDRDRMIRFQDKPGGMQDSASFLVERAEHAGRLRQGKPVADREADPELVDCLAGLLLGIRARRNHRNLLRHQLVLRSIAGS